jgi:hypothetical protein
MGFSIKKKAKKVAKNAKKGSTYKPIIEAETYEPMEVIVKSKSYEPIVEIMPTIQPVREKEKLKFVPPVAIEDDEDEEVAIKESSNDQDAEENDDSMIYMFIGVAILTFALFLGNRTR